MKELDLLVRIIKHETEVVYIEPTNELAVLSKGDAALLDLELHLELGYKCVHYIGEL